MSAEGCKHDKFPPYINKIDIASQNLSGKPLSGAQTQSFIFMQTGVFKSVLAIETKCIKILVGVCELHSFAQDMQISTPE